MRISDWSSDVCSSDLLVFDLISDWRVSDQAFPQHAYGELVGLVATTKAKDSWVRARNEILASGTEGARIGLANSAVNMWSDEKLRQTSGKVLVELLTGGSTELVGLVVEVDRKSDVKGR